MDSGNERSREPGLWALALATRDGLQRKAARSALVAMGREATPVLLRLLEDPHAVVRWEAALALKSVADPVAVPALTRVLGDKDQDVRWVAAEALGVIGRPALEDLLTAVAAGADHIELRGAAELAFGLLRDPADRELVAPVVDALRTGSQPERVIVAASEALAALRNGGRSGT